MMITTKMRCGKGKAGVDTREGRGSFNTHIYENYEAAAARISNNDAED